MVSLDARYTTHYPITSALITSRTKDAVSTLNSLSEKIFEKEKFSINIFYNASFTSYADLKEQSFTDLTQIIDTYIKNIRTKQYLIAFIATACVVGAVANAILGFAALGVALSAAFLYLPYEQSIHEIKIKAALRNCESNAGVVKSLDELKEIFKVQEPLFDKVAEPFYYDLYKSGQTDKEICRKYLSEITAELKKQNKLVNAKNQALYSVSLSIIVEQYKFFLLNGNCDQSIANAKYYLNFVTEQHLVNNTFPIFRNADDNSDDGYEGIIPIPPGGLDNNTAGLTGGAGNNNAGEVTGGTGDNTAGAATGGTGDNTAGEVTGGTGDNTAGEVTGGAGNNTAGEVTGGTGDNTAGAATGGAGNNTAGEVTEGTGDNTAATDEKTN